MERAIQTQRLKLLRLVAGLVVAVRFLSVGPVSRVFSDWACGFVGSVLSRAELAARYLVIAQARSLLARRGLVLECSGFSQDFNRAFDAQGAEMFLADCRRRLRVLQQVLKNLPRHALRLIRRIERQTRAACTDQAMPCPDLPLSASLQNRQLAKTCIERPPDKVQSASPPPLTSLRFSDGGRRRLGLAIMRA